jgi:hypothetical protein
MAKKEKLIYGDEKQVCFNIDGDVGFSSPNLTGDVMLIQAMFNFIFKGNRFLLGVESNDLPQITGTFDADTGYSIMKFQFKWMRNLTTQKSGVLFPGYYKKKIPLMVGDGYRRQAMFLLHQFAQEAAARMGETDYTVKMLNMFPELKPFTK